MLRAFAFEGGPHDGEHIDDSTGHPTTLFAISFDDGSSYARAGEQRKDATGGVRDLFRFADDGSLTDVAQQRFAGIH
jgi:hypothetical protein